MRFLFVGILLTSAAAYAAQDMMQLPPVPKEFAQANFFLGKWQGTEKVSGMGGAPTTAKATMVGTKTLDGRYIQSMHTMDMGKMGKMEGMHLLSFDPFKKKFMAYWFDSSAPGVMEMSGGFTGNKLIMVSKPVEIPGMPGKMVMRASWTKVNAKQIEFRLESQQGKSWSPMISGSFRKVG